MNTLPKEKKIQIVNLMVEGSSMRSISRICDVSINTVSKLLVDIGKSCEKFHNETVKNLRCQRVQADEIWSFVYAKEKNAPENMEGFGDVWTWTAIDADTKLIIGWLVGERDAESANLFMHDIAARVSNKMQLTTDGLKAYLQVVDDAFGGNIDFAQLVKLCGAPEGNSSTERKYSPNECTGAKKTVISGAPKEKFISTSYVERQNLTMRMHMRRFTRLTNAFNKKIENHCYAIALHFVYYNFAKIHKSLRVTPAMQAGLTKKPFTLEDIINLVEIEASKKRGTYKKKDL